MHALLVLPNLLTLAAAGDFTGRGRVVDGDTIDVAGAPARIRLDGIDAPEGNQTCRDAAGVRYLCGPKAAEALSQLIGRSGRVSCTQTGADRHQRIVGTCKTGTVDLQLELVRQGWAVDFSRYSKGKYAAVEKEARDAKRGLWAGTFDMPWDWRAGQKSGSRPVGLLAPLVTQSTLPTTTATSCKSALTCRDAVILWCSGYSRADADSDGIPCENVCRSLKQVEPIKKEIGCSL